MDTGIPKGSPVSRILFTVYLSGLFGYVEERVPGVKAPSFVDDVAWTREGETEDGISETLEANAVTFDTQKTEAIFLSRRRKRRTPAAPPETSRLQDTRSTSTRRQPDGSASGSTPS